MDNITKNDHVIGLLVQRKNIPHPTAQDIKKELLLYIFEAQISLKTIYHIRHKQLIFFDGNVGDAKCQTRASMLLDLFEDEKLLLKTLEQEEFQLLSLIEKIQNIIIVQRFNDHGFIKHNLVKFKYVSMLDFMIKHELFFTPSSQLLLTGLSYIIHLPKQEMNVLMSDQISNNKRDKLRDLAKIKLCLLSIEYERNLALTCGSSEDCKILTQIESKQYSSSLTCMTACFPSFKLILRKMKEKNQPILLVKIIFCTCGGITSQENILFKWTNNTFQSIDFNAFPINQPLTIMEGYQFKGSFVKLKTILNVPIEEELITPEFRKPCICTNQTTHLPINNFEEIILGYFAQHSQFTNNASINFENLELQESDLKKEYDYLQTVPGCSNQDMSIVSLKHVYISTITNLKK